MNKFKKWIAPAKKWIAPATAAIVTFGYATLASAQVVATDPLGVASSTADIVTVAKFYINLAISVLWPIFLGAALIGAVVGVIIALVLMFKHKASGGGV